MTLEDLRANPASLVTIDEVAGLVRVKRQTFDVWRHRGVDLPPVIVLTSRAKRMRAGDVLAWLDRCCESKSV